ncbi:thioredoxin family protein [Candidatus Woesearchaeota archaeon]|nr:thioredoxin family protein [Candidatus Woesearchaeota archaeon]
MNLKKIVLAVVLIVVVWSIISLEKTKVSPLSSLVTPTLESSLPKASQPAFKDGKYPLAPELTGIVGYINTNNSLKIADLRGKVVLVDFWTYSCINCIRTLPYLISWYEKYHDNGLVIIGVHTPEFEFEKERDNVVSATKRYNITYPVVQDNNYGTWNAFKNRYWPRKYLIDKEGYIRFDHIGEGRYEETEKQIQELLGEMNVDVADTILTPEKIEEKMALTAETYTGYELMFPRGQNSGNDEGVRADRTFQYVLPKSLPEDTFTLEGLWSSGKEQLASKGESSLYFNYLAKSINVVAAKEELSVTVEILLDGKSLNKENAGSDITFVDGRSFLIVTEPRLYNLVEGEYGRYTITLKTTEGLLINAFTFG